MNRNVREFTRLAVSEGVAAVFFNHAVSTQVTIEGKGKQTVASLAVSRLSDQVTVELTLLGESAPATSTLSNANFDNLVENVFDALSPHLAGQNRLNAHFAGQSLQGGPLKSAVGNSDSKVIVQVDNLNETGSASILELATRQALAHVESGLDKSARIRVTSPGHTWPTWVEFNRLPSNGNFIASTNDIDLFVGAGPSLFVSDARGELTRQRAVSYLQGEFEEGTFLDVTIFLDHSNGSFPTVLEGTSHSGRLEQPLHYDI